MRNTAMAVIACLLATGAMAQEAGPPPAPIEAEPGTIPVDSQMRRTLQDIDQRLRRLGTDADGRIRDMTGYDRALEAARRPTSAPPTPESFRPNPVSPPFPGMPDSSTGMAPAVGSDMANRAVEAARAAAGRAAATAESAANRSLDAANTRNDAAAQPFTPPTPQPAGPPVSPYQRQPGLAGVVDQRQRLLFDPEAARERLMRSGATPPQR